MKKILVYLLALPLFVTLLNSCSSNSGTDILPEDALLVMSVDVKNTLASAGEDMNKELNGSIKDFINYMELSRTDEDKLYEIVDNPMSSGIDLAKPIYLSIDEEENVIITGLVKNIQNFEEMLDPIASIYDTRIKDISSDIKYVNIEDMIVMFNNTYFAIRSLSYYDEEDDVIDEMQNMFTQKTSFTNTKSYQNLQAENGLIKMVVTPEIYRTDFYDEIIDDAYDELGIDLSEYYKIMKDAITTIALNAQNGNVTLVSNVDYITEEAKMKMEEYLSVIGNIDGTHLPYVEDNAIFTIATNFNGNKLWNLISDLLEDLDIFSNSELDEIENIIKSFDGDVTLTADSKLLYIDYEAVPEIKLYAATKDNGVVNTVSELAEEIFDVEKNGENEWIASIEDYYSDEEIGYMTLGYDKNTSYFLLKEKKTKALETADNQTSKSLYTGNNLSARFNVPAFLNTKIDGDKISTLIKEEDPTVYKAISSIEYIDFVVKGNRSTYTMTTVEKDRNPIELFLDMFI